MRNKKIAPYVVDRDAALRCYEFYENAQDTDPGVIAYGISLGVKDTKGQIRLLKLEKIVLPDRLIRFIMETFKGKYNEG